MAAWKSREERQVALAEANAEQSERIAEMERYKTRRDAERSFQAMPSWEKAAIAFQRGDTFFQVDLPHSSVTGDAGTMLDPKKSGTILAADTPQNALGLIEAAGWRLQHASWVFVETGQDSRDKFLMSGQSVVVNGQVVGVYLFRRDEKRPD
jgi:hypothetical protein